MSTDLDPSGMAGSLVERQVAAPAPCGTSPKRLLRRVILVAGSGRSGTSTVAGVLKEIGVHVPQPEVMPDNTNPKGFAEPRWLVDFHQDLLARARVQVSDARPAAWFDAGVIEVDEEARARAATWLEEQFLDADEVVLKDPRLIWFSGLWQGVALRVGAEVSVVTMLRPPTEVVGSKSTYYGHRGDIDSLAGWLNLMLHTERATRGVPRLFVTYTDLLEDWTVPLARMGALFNLSAIKRASAARINTVHQFVDPDLRRVAVGWDELEVPDQLRDLASRAWDLLAGLAEEEAPEARAALDELRVEYADYYEQAEAIAHSSVRAASRRSDHLRERRDQLVAKRKVLQAKVADVRGERNALARRNEALSRRLHAAERRIAVLESRTDRSVYARLKRRVPALVKRSVRRVAGSERIQPGGGS